MTELAGRTFLRRVALTLILALAAGLSGCSKNGKTPNPPHLQNLSLSSTLAYLTDGGGSVRVDFSVEVADTRANVNSLVITVLDVARNQLARFSDPISNPAGVTHGSLQGYLVVPTAVATTYTFEFQAFDSDGGASNVQQASFAVRPHVVPVLTGFSPYTAVAGAGIQLTVTGSGFDPSSFVLWNGRPIVTSFVSPLYLLASVHWTDMETVGSAAVSVVNSGPGGGTSNALPFEITRPGQPGVTVVGVQASDLVWDPYQRRIHLSALGGPAAAVNTISSLDPFTGSMTGSQPTRAAPGPLVISDDGQFVYVSLASSSSVDRFTLPALTRDLSIPMGNDIAFGPLMALDLQVAPGHAHELAVSLGADGLTAPAVGGVAVFDDAVPRTNRTGRWPPSLFGSMQWGSSADVLYGANDESTGYDFYVAAVDATGVALTSDYPSVFSSFRSSIHFDSGTGLVYGDDGHAVDPATGLSVGTFAPGVRTRQAMTPDSAIGSAFFVSQDSTTTSTVLRAFDLTSFLPTRSLSIPYLPARPLRVVRWGSDGLAFLSGDSLVLVRGAFVLPVATSPNPAPAVSALAPPGAVAGSGNLKVSVTGTGFVPGSVVWWNGAERTTRRVSPTEVTAYLPASDLATAASANVVVVNPAPGGGASTATSFTVTP